MSSVNFDFEQARIKHIQFKNNLRSLLFGISDINEDAVVSERACAVGKWIYDYALQAYGYIPEMQELEIIHKELHHTAKGLVTLYNSGNVIEAREGMPSIEKIAENLISTLSTVEKKVNERPADTQSAPGYQSLEKMAQEMKHLGASTDLLAHKINQLNLELEHEKKSLKDILLQLPAMIAIIKGDDLVIEMANQPILDFLKKGSITGLTVKEALPEIENQGFIKMITDVYKSGNPVVLKEVKLELNNENGQPEETYHNVNYLPVINSQGKIEGVISFSYDVTETVRSRQMLEDTINRLHYANEDLEVKVAFRNLQLEKEIVELKAKLGVKS